MISGLHVVSNEKAASPAVHPARQGKKPETEFDVLIQGGGINGAATAEELSRRGLKVGLIEMNDIGAGTTAYSSRLVHGGLRYLEFLKALLTPWKFTAFKLALKPSEHIQLVRESLREREILLHRAPHLVKPLPLGMPAYSYSGLDKPNLKVAMRLYDALSFDKTLPKFKEYGTQALQDLLPGLSESVPILDKKTKTWKTGQLQGGAVYYDAQVALPERLTLEHALAAKEHGATIFNHTRVDEITTEPVEVGKKRRFRKVTAANLQATGVRATDLLTGEAMVLKAKVVINATGSWIDNTLQRVASTEGADARNTSFDRRMGGTKGSHILTPMFDDTLKDKALSFFSSDGRHMFIEPFNENYLLIGTTDIPYTDEDPGKAVADREEIEYMYNEVKRAFPQARLAINDILWVYSGVRPLPYAPPGTEPGKITRKHIIEDHSHDPKNPVRGLVSLYGKITTARSLGEEAAEKVIHDYKLLDGPFTHITNGLSLPGGRGIGKGQLETYKAEAWKNSQASLPWLTQPVLNHLIDLYGSRYKDVLQLARQKPELRAPLAEGSNNIAAQVVYAVQSEFAGAVADVMRRTGAVLNAHAGLDEVAAVGQVLKDELGWPKALVEQDIRAYREYIATQNGELWRLQQKAQDAG